MALAIFGGVCLLYLGLGLTLLRAPSRPLYASNLLFEADVARLTLDITSTEGPHWRSNVHPLFVLLANPFGSLFAKVLGGRTASGAILFDALAGALAAAVSLRLFWGISSGNMPRAILATLITALSMSRLIFSSIPETYALSTLSIVTTHLLFWVDLYERRVPLGVWAAGGIFSLGVTVTNFAQTFLCFVLARHARPQTSMKQTALSAAQLVALVLTGGAVLNVIQGALYPSTGFLTFLRPSEVGRESWFLRLDILRTPTEVFSELFKNFFVVNVVGGIPNVVPGTTAHPQLTFGGSWAFSPYGYAALAVWVALAFAPTGREPFTRHGRFYAGLALCVLFNLLLHAVYFDREAVIEYFIYTGNFTFPVMALVVGRWVSTPCVAGAWALGVFLMLLAINNLDVMWRIIGYYR